MKRIGDASRVAEKDAFGRDVGEDPLAAMGWDDAGVATQSAPRESPQESPRHERATGLAPGAMPGAPRRAGVLRALISLVVVLVLLGTLAVIAVPRVVDAVKSLTDELEDPPSLPRGEDEPDATPPAGLQKGSLVLRGNLAPALRRLEQRSDGGRVRLLRIAPDRIDAQVVTPDRRLRNLQHRFTGETVVLSDTSAPGAGVLTTFRWNDIDASAPRRLAERAVRGRSSRELSYLVLLDAGGLRWSAFLASGSGFTAGPDGRGARRIGS
jgi:hypothetical protein